MLFDKLKNKIFGSKEDEIDNSSYNTDNTVSLIQVSVAPNLYLVHKGARICVGREPLEGYIAQYKHIQKMMGFGHESILEHSNVIFILSMSKDLLRDPEISCDLTEFLAETKYLNIRTKEKEDKINILIGGSIRGYMHVLRESDQDNFFIFYIKQIMYGSVDKAFLGTLIEKGILEEDKCTYVPLADVQDIKEEDLNKDELDLDASYNTPEVIPGERVDLVYNTPLDILDILSRFGFDKDDLFSVGTVTLRMHDVSRSCSNQMTRHRVGISQESQRYCEHKTDPKEDFVNPIILNLKDRYRDLDPEVKKHMDELDPFNNYKYFIGHNIVKEDARAWLPMNSKTQLLMTFTYKQLFHFVKLRSEPGAQTEVRLVAKDLKDILSYIFSTDKDMSAYISYYLTPMAYRKEEDRDIDDDLGEFTSQEEVKQDISMAEPTSLDIKDLEDAKRLLKKNEEYKNL